jgi:hypothetical protein
VTGAALLALLRKVPAFAWLSIALFLALAVQTTRIEGFKVWPLHISGLKVQLADTKQQLADTKVAFAQTVANYRAAAEQAKRDDAANVARVKIEQSKINQESSDEFEARLAAARATAQRLRDQLAAQANPGGRSAAPVSGVPVATKGSAQGADANRLSIDERLIATEQAIQLDELIKWVKRQAGVDVNGAAPKP